MYRFTNISCPVRFTHGRLGRMEHHSGGCSRGLWILPLPLWFLGRKSWRWKGGTFFRDCPRKLGRSSKVLCRKRTPWHHVYVDLATPSTNNDLHHLKDPSKSHLSTETRTFNRFNVSANTCNIWCQRYGNMHCSLEIEMLFRLNICNIVTIVVFFAWSNHIA